MVLVGVRGIPKSSDAEAKGARSVWTGQWCTKAVASAANGSEALSSPEKKLL